jgi:hypothetical protein
MQLSGPGQQTARNRAAGVQKVNTLITASVVRNVCRSIQSGIAELAKLSVDFIGFLKVCYRSTP